MTTIEDREPGKRELLGAGSADLPNDQRRIEGRGGLVRDEACDPFVPRNGVLRRFEDVCDVIDPGRRDDLACVVELKRPPAMGPEIVEPGEHGGLQRPDRAGLGPGMEIESSSVIWEIMASVADSVRGQGELPRHVRAKASSIIR